MKQEIKVLSFDLDDTLWPCHPTIYQAEQTLYQWLTEHVPVISQHYDLLQLRDKRKLLLEQRPELAHDLSQLRLYSFEALAIEFDLDRDWISMAFDVFYDARQKVTLFDDVAPVLDTLSENYCLVSLTNGNADPVKTGIDHWFDLSLNSMTVGKQKSEPDIYRQVQQSTAIDAAQMVHIGDDPVQDIVGAKSAGARAIWLNRDKRQWQPATCEPDAQISSLLQLPDLLDAWQR